MTPRTYPAFSIHTAAAPSYPDAAEHSYAQSTAEPSCERSSIPLTTEPRMKVEATTPVDEEVVGGRWRWRLGWFGR